MYDFQIFRTTSKSVSPSISSNINNLYDAKNLNKSIKTKNKFFSFDQSIHAAMAELNKSKNKDNITSSSITELLKSNWIHDGYESINEESKFFQRGITMLSRYNNYPQDEGLDSLVINKFLNKKVDKHCTLFSKLDKVYETKDGRIEIVDYKTGRIIGHYNNFDLDLRTAVYVTLVKEIFNIYPSVVSYYYLYYNRKFTKAFTKYEVDISYPFILNEISKLSNLTH